ncbi:MAG TPA: FAD-dependent oxidoreductase [Terriglobales bacterium]|nr:FAD-dependent oxidoreductase [Terriglobales bacterium]
MSSNRRDFIKFVVVGAVAAGCPLDGPLLAVPSQNKLDVDGESNTICHQVRDGKVFSRPPASGHHEVIIVGGGVSGLSAAYHLQNRDFLLLEKEPHWGGNAYLMEYDGQAYATGAAFIWSGDVVYSFAKEIGLEPLPINDWDGTIVNGEFVADTWGDGLDRLPYPAAVRESFKKAKRDILAIDADKRAAELFNVPFSDFLKGYSPEVKAWWDGYGPSNWGATSDDTAAMLGISEFKSIAADGRRDVRYTWPGGNGALTKRLSELLQGKFSERLQTGATVIAVAPQTNEVQVTYLQNGEVKTVAAKAVIMASPKFITHRLVEGLPAKQSEAMRQIRYIPYPVVNLIFDKQVFDKGYDNWCPGNTFTDFIVADWVLRKQPGYQPKRNILTCYTPMSEEERGRLLTETGARRVAQDVLTDFQKLFPGSNVDPLEVHIYRRGHPMYMSTPGLYTKVQPVARQPFDRIFFANTDSEGPESSSSSAIRAAQRAVAEVEHRLAGKPGSPQKSAALLR